MYELFDPSPKVNVQPDELKRLLGLPQERELEGRLLELADWARDWYAAHGRPWVYARQTAAEYCDDHLSIGGANFSAKRLERGLRQLEAQSVILVAVSAGGEIEQQARQAWLEEKPDEYFFLEMYGSAVVEHLITSTGARLCDFAEQNGLAVLPHDSPGYPEWDVSEQPRLLKLISIAAAVDGRLETLESGMLRPKKSQLAVFGLTAHTARLRRLVDLIPCESCSFGPCQYRRAPYAGQPVFSMQEMPRPRATPAPARASFPLSQDAIYTVNARALNRWASERLSLVQREDGHIDANFRYDGTTCTNMGCALTFHYHVTLGPRNLGYRILRQECAPAPDDTGHTFMCSYLKVGGQILSDIAADQPLLGRPLNDVLSWSRPTDPAGCYCDASSRLHKWGLVLQTIHFALARQEKQHEEAAS